MGGSYLTDPSWNATSWDFNGTLAKTQTDLFVKALFSAEVEVDPHNSSQRIIAVSDGYQPLSEQTNKYTSRR